MEEFLPACTGKIESMCEHAVEIEQGKGWDQEIRLVDFAEVHRFHPSSFQHQHPDHNHSKHEYDRQGCKISGHEKNPLFYFFVIGKGRKYIKSLQQVCIAFLAD